MGFFGKLKQNFTHGGVDVKLQAPASASTTEASIPVTVTVSATDSPQTVNKVRAEIVAQSNNQAFNTSTSSQGSSRRTVAQSENAQQFVVNPGQSVTVQLSIVMNAGAAIADQLPEGSGLAQIAGAIEKLQDVANVLNQDSYTYEVIATADVAGIALDPSDSAPIQILKPGQLGGAINIHL